MNVLYMPHAAYQPGVTFGLLPTRSTELVLVWVQRINDHASTVLELIQHCNLDSRFIASQSAGQSLRVWGKFWCQDRKSMVISMQQETYSLLPTES